MTDAAAPASRSLRVATWNMDHWRRTLTVREAGWAQLRTVVQPDLALLQETEPPRDLRRGSVVYREIGRVRRWGSAVVALSDASLEEIWSARSRYSPQTFPLTNTFPGSVAIARATIPGSAPVTLVSVYTVIDVYSQTTLLRVVADLIPLFDSVDGKRVILGGDLNLSTDAHPGLEARRYEAIIRAVESLGLVNLYESVSDRPAPPTDCPCARPSCRHLTTRAGGGQFDHLFASPDLARQCLRIVRFNDEHTQTLSDHWPVAADFELVAGTKRRWDVETFAREIGARHGAGAARAIDVIADWAEQKERRLRSAGHERFRLRLAVPESAEPEMWLQLDRDQDLGWQYTISVKARGDVVVQFRYIAHPPFDRDEKREELRRRFNLVPSIRINRSTGRPVFPIAVLDDPERLAHVLDVVGWVVDETVLADAAPLSDATQPVGPTAALQADPDDGLRPLTR